MWWPGPHKNVVWQQGSRESVAPRNWQNGIAWIWNVTLKSVILNGVSALYRM